jgi:hypothetical protein
MMIKRRAIVLVALAAIWLGFAQLAQAADETIGLSMKSEPSVGPLYREVYRPVDASLSVTVTAPPSSTKVTPIKVANVTFPSDMDFFPNPKKTPVCPESKLNPQSNLAAGIAAIVSLCPDSVVGTGTSAVKLAKLNLPTADVTDPQLVIFNAGREDDGRPKIVIYGYSRQVNSGLLMHGTLARDGQLRIEIGVMPADSAVSQFTLGIPGEPIGSVKGLYPEYLRAKCSTGTWRATGSFVLGERSDPSGVPTGPDTLLASNPFELPCKGRAGKAKLKIKKVSGPKKLIRGRKSSYLVTVTNPGTATARSVRIRTSGAGIGFRKVGVLAPGASRKVPLKVKASARAGVRKLKFQVSANERVHKESIRKVRVGNYRFCRRKCPRGCFRERRHCVYPEANRWAGMPGLPAGFVRRLERRRCIGCE